MLLQKVAVEVLSDGIIDEMFHLSDGIIDEMLRGLCFTMSLVFEDNIIIPPAAHEIERVLQHKPYYILQNANKYY